MLGTSQWLTPNGRHIRKQGIEPDVTVKLPIGTNLLSPLELKESTASDVLNSEDAQLLKALNLLQATPQTPTDQPSQVQSSGAGK